MPNKCYALLPFRSIVTRLDLTRITYKWALRKDFVIPFHFNSTAQTNNGTTAFIKYVREGKKRIKMNGKKKLKSFNAKREGKHDAKALKNKEKKKIEK